MEGCKWCKELNAEKGEIRIDEIYIDIAGYYQYDCPIRHCPYCGKMLNKYNQKKDKPCFEFNLT